MTDFAPEHKIVTENHESNGHYYVESTESEGSEASPIDHHSSSLLSPYSMDSSDAASARSSRSTLDQFPDQDSSEHKLKKKVSIQ